MNLLTEGARVELKDSRLSVSETKNPEKPKTYTTQKLENILKGQQR